jgi:UDP-N-acetylmuramate dehydrogenase
MRFEDINYDFVSEIKDNVLGEIKINESMKKHTTFHIGGYAKYFVTVVSVEDLRQIIRITKKYNIKRYILGNGSNILVNDNGLDGIVIKIGIIDLELTLREEVNEKSGETETFYLLKAYSGASIKSVILKASELGIGPVSNIYGIPGTVGGALIMNAGAFDLEMKDIVFESEYMDLDGVLHTIDLGRHNFGYRKSVFKNSENIIVSTTFKFKKVDKEEQLKHMDYIINRRKKYQPLEWPSAGSTFKRGEDYIVSLLIDECNLKGKSVGGAMVSTKHAGFVINSGDAKAKDVLELVSQVKEIVLKEKGKEIDLEVIILD